MQAEFESDVTVYLNRLGGNREEPPGEFVALIYRELQGLARAQMARQPSDHTLTPTGLVNEMWMRVASGPRERSWNDRKHFFRAAVKAMRSVLVDHARARLAEKRGAGKNAVTFDENFGVGIGDAGGVIELDLALGKLERVDPELAEVVQLRFFGSLSNQDLADHLRVGLRTVERRWQTARLWLLDELGETGQP